MPDLVFGQDDVVGEWVAAVLGTKPQRGCPAIGMAKDDQIIGGVVYHDYRLCAKTGRPLSIEATLASTTPRWATRAVLHAIFAYPFLQLGVQRITTLCNAHDEHVVAFNRRLGFTQESVLKKGWSVYENAALWRMLRHECKWIKEES